MVEVAGAHRRESRTFVLPRGNIIREAAKKFHNLLGKLTQERSSERSQRVDSALTRSSAIATTSLRLFLSVAGIIFVPSASPSTGLREEPGPTWPMANDEIGGGGVRSNCIT
ncbi:hypothetical protein CRG98_001468 [Punica granatum]|uniref:Uncharacterized protein n=1 Tax=Punica granatum TaxID=22663 RepID=A0A2I0LBT3_PUNGR|nr:hypothetical protein CRG98_001468 [Punica granatum]